MGLRIKDIVKMSDDEIKEHAQEIVDMESKIRARCIFSVGFGSLIIIAAIVLLIIYWDRIFYV